VARFISTCWKKRIKKITDVAIIRLEQIVPVTAKPVG
jgi:hypothetical protein